MSKRTCITLCRRFAADESGAVFLDYLIGAAAGVAVAILLTQDIGNGTRTLADAVSSEEISRGALRQN